MQETSEALAAGLAVGEDQSGSASDLRPIIIGLMGGTPLVAAFSADVRSQITLLLERERAEGRLGAGTMPDTFNPAVRAREWQRTSESLAPYLSYIGNDAADGARVTGATVEVLEGVIVRLVLTRAHAEPTEVLLDPLAAQRLEGALR